MKIKEKIRKTLKEWEIEKGIIIKNIKIKNKKCKESAFKKLIRKNEIVVKTNKGLEYLESVKAN